MLRQRKGESLNQRAITIESILFVGVVLGPANCSLDNHLKKRYGFVENAFTIPIIVV